MDKIIRFQDEIYLLIDEGEFCGPITKEKDFISGKPSYAHLYKNGNILRFGEKIGTREDIEIIGEKQIRIPDIFATLSTILTEDWRKNKDENSNDDE